LKLSPGQNRGKYPVITPWSKIVLGKLIVSQLFKKYSIFYKSRRFLIVFIRVELCFIDGIKPA
jgi:hypothetical protein